MYKKHKYNIFQDECKNTKDIDFYDAVMMIWRFLRPCVVVTIICCLYGYTSVWFSCLGTKKNKDTMGNMNSHKKKGKKYLSLWWIFWLEFLLVLHKNMWFITYYCIIALGTFFRVEKVTWVCEKTTYPYFCFCTTCLSMIFNDSQQTLLVTSERR